MRPPNRVRMLAAAAAAATLALGLALQAFRFSVWTDAAGGALYTLLVGMLVLLAAPRLPAWTVAAIALGWSVAIELLQLTPIPGAIVAAFPPAHLVVGNAWDPWDLCSAAAGALLVWPIAAALRTAGTPVE
ncbi:DUF2809 domain-containing protein [Agromyces seonyuensis]|uniref:DUF2809 domain-containing protein n=1 Tax=Agromyces seonyuensis TaxID=2662446 RepID=A0A6I4P5Q1_9MICO|nr:DUF2809 domain-containing protein [Agromyces seonyuensis]MWC00406.1 DUF2809 domain-containing protein [Agromyces seonyuensis]